MIKMFWGIDKSPPRFLNGHYFLISANALWQRPKEYNHHRFVKRKYDRRFMMLDSGGFAFFSQYNDYPFSREQYLNLVKHYRPLAWIPMDYPCESGLKNNCSVQDRIDMTVDNLKFFSRYEKPHGIVPVVQGFTLSERIQCLDLILKKGLDRPLMALGSLCALADLGQISAIVNGLCDYAKTVGYAGKFHLFGVSINYIKKYNLPNNIYSFDTSAWQFYKKYNEHEQAFKSYRESVSQFVCFGYHEKLKCDGQFA